MSREAKKVSALGQMIRQKRRAMGMSQRDLARETGLSDAYLCQIEKGHVIDPGLLTCIAIAKRLEVPIDTLADWRSQPWQDRPICSQCGQEIDP